MFDLFDGPCFKQKNDLTKKGFSTDRSYEFFLGINDGMTEGEYKFDNSPLQVAYTNFATDDLPNIEGVNEVVYKVKN